jgi:hypothetical protein
MAQTSFGSRLSPRPGVPLSVTQAAQLRALQNQFSLTSWPYYSKVKFFAPLAAPVVASTYTLQRGAQSDAFSYAIGEGKQSAGYTTGDGNATAADTNLQQRGNTISGQNVWISGIAIQVVPSTMHLDDGQVPPHRVRQPDARFLSALFNSVSVELSLNGGENTFKLGTLGMVPGAGGLTGGGYDSIGLIALAGDDRNLDFGNNGWAVRSNAKMLPEGLIWRTQSRSDSMLNLNFNNTRAIQLFTGGSPENNVGDVAADNLPANVATGTEGYAFPSEVVCEFMVHLLGRVKAPRTRSV